MASNFSFLGKNPQYNSFSGACSEAERSIAVSPATTAILARRALELAVKWLYSYDRDLKVPYQDNLSSLIHERSEEHTSELQSRPHLVCRLLLEKKKSRTPRAASPAPTQPGTPPASRWPASSPSAGAPSSPSPTTSSTLVASSPCTSASRPPLTH